MSTLDLGKLKYLWRGTWSTGSSYLPNDVVAYNGGIWICTQSHGTGLSTEFSPGRRDRNNVLAKTVDPAEVIVVNVTVGTSGANNVFYLDGRATPAITIYPNVRYRFMQKDSSNAGQRLAFSTTADGIFGSGGVEYTTNVFQYGTPGSDGYVDLVLDSTAPATLYYYSANGLGYGSGTSGRLIRTPAWRGWQYWDQVTSGFTFKGGWTSVTQYYYNDIIEYEGATYLALADNINRPPTTPDVQRTMGSLTANASANLYTQYWQLMTPGDRMSEHNAVAHFMNKGPIDWPYPPGNNGNNNHLQAIKWISRSGRVYNAGVGNNNHGLQEGFQYATNPQPQEVAFNHHDWWASRDNGGNGRLTTPDGQPPRCIQVEAGWTWAYYLFNNGEVWASGTNPNGELGDGSTTTRQMPRRVIGLNDVRIVKISASYGPLVDNRHVLALDDQGYVWTWGRNDSGQLGTGDTSSSYRPAPQRLPRSYFGGERVIDILAMGNGSSGSASNGWSYARVASDNLYAWGRNNENQLGNGDTTNRYRPVKMTNWDPVLNAGIRKWQAYGFPGSASFMILDGNGFIWHCGNDYGHSTFAAAATRTQLTKSTTVPNGSIVNFWNVWSGDTSVNCATFLRHSNGTTYVCGQGNNNNNTNGTTGGTSQVLSPALLSTTLGTGSALVNIKEVYVHISFTSDNRRTIHFLRDDGKVYAQGYNGYGELGNPYISLGGQNNTDESGSTNFPVVTFTPPSHKIVSILPGGSGATDLNWAHGMFYLAANGQMFASGQNRNATFGAAVGDDRRRRSGMLLTFVPQIGEGASLNTVVSTQYAR
jgi:alpha-tubulin suppressor-like RCC1 family protein